MAQSIVSPVTLAEGGAVNEPARSPRRLPLLQTYLRQQGELTAVERFAQRHAAGELTESYSDLIPLSKPGPGEQYAFEVDLAACTGCKACVTACHRLNGLDPKEAWRDVGVLLNQGSPDEPGPEPALLQTVTTACHHCLEPACMHGCPVKAYEKDPLTGIVRHLDDQCIGCQYCVFTCPYDVPKFNAALGVVRKCDLCSDRLDQGEAPACVQACPNDAIRVETFSVESAAVRAVAGDFLPGTPDPALTKPTTRYVGRELPVSARPADFFDVRPAEHHGPLVLMLVLTQLSAGAFLIEHVLAALGGVPSSLRDSQAWFALSIALIALAGSVAHLGRPQFAFRALLGLRTSWLSREIAAFGGFAALAAAYAVGRSGWLPAVEPLVPVLGWSAVAAGAIGVGTSVMVYHATRRDYWHGARTGFRFFSTSVLLGAAVTWALVELQAATGGAAAWHGFAATILAVALPLLTATKLGLELLSIAPRTRRSETLERSAQLLRGQLKTDLFWRLLLGGAGGLLLPVLAQLAAPGSPQALAAAVFGGLFLLLSELIERRLFFTAVSPARMPGVGA